MLRTAIAATALSLLMVQIVEARINTNSLTCHQAQSLVRSRGAIVLSTGRYTYDRFVVNRAFCFAGEYTKKAYVPTRDRRSCPIGYICTPDDPWEFMHD